MAKERYQNPVLGDEINLRLFVYNSNNLRNIERIEKVELFHLDPAQVTQANPEGLTLVETFDSDDITNEETGKYLLTATLSSPSYTPGYYRDVWTVVFEGDETPATISNPFRIYTDLWFTTTVPPVYDFQFEFRPNRIRRGTKRYVHIRVTPNVPTATDLAAYYENLAIAGDLRVTMSLACGDCVPAEEDLRVVVDQEPVQFREKCYGYWFLDTTDLELGTYDVHFELEVGENLYLSEINQLQIVR